MGAIIERDGYLAKVNKYKWFIFLKASRYSNGRVLKVIIQRYDYVPRLVDQDFVLVDIVKKSNLIFAKAV